MMLLPRHPPTAERAGSSNIRDSSPTRLTRGKLKHWTTSRSRPYAFIPKIPDTSSVYAFMFREAVVVWAICHVSRDYPTHNVRTNELRLVRGKIRPKGC